MIGKGLSVVLSVFDARSVVFVGSIGRKRMEDSVSGKHHDHERANDDYG